MSRFLSLLGKINFILKRTPKIEKKKDWNVLIPYGNKAVVTITADFELAWSWRYAKGVANAYKFAIEKARIERQNVPEILSLCEEYAIPLTWASVGHLFLSHCRKENGRPHSEIPIVKPYRGPYWDFDGKDWFEYDPCSNYKEAPEWYAPDLIDKIIASNVKHEIGCHTFSHIDCRDEVCPTELFVAELKACQREAEKLGIHLNTFVHPGHTIGNLNNLVKLGFTSFQSDPGNILGYPIQMNNGLWELKRTYEFVYRKDWSIDYHIWRYRKIIDRAIQYHSVCNFWFHPSFNPLFVRQILPEIFKYIAANKDKLFITTVGNYINFLNQINK